MSIARLPMVRQPPYISVIVPAYNCSDTITKCIESLLAQDYPNYEIIIVDDGSTDDTHDICRSYDDRIKLIQTSNGGPSRARNIGVREARGDIVAFTDSDCLAHEQWLNQLNRGFDKGLVAGVGGNQVSPSDESHFGKTIQDTLSILGFATSYMKPHSSITKTQHNPSCNSAYRKKCFEEIGGFDESMWPGEDVDLDYRLMQRGYTLIRNPEAIVSHYRPQSIPELSGMMRRYGVSAYNLLIRYGFFRLLHYMPFVFLIGLVGSIMLLVYNPVPLLAAISVVIVFYMIFITSKGLLKKSPLIFSLSVVIVVSWHLGFFGQPLNSLLRTENSKSVGGSLK